MNRQVSLTEFGNYLRANITTPVDWDESKFGIFPGSALMLQKYFVSILKENKNHVKIAAIEERFVIQRYLNIDEKAAIIDGKPRSILNFFRKDITPFEKHIDFIAVVFDAPIKSFEEYLALKNGENIKQVKKPAKQLLKLGYLKNKRVLFSILILVFFLGLYPLSKFVLNLFASGQEKTEHIGFFPKNLDENFIERNFIQKDQETVIFGDSGLDTVLIHTINIFNDQCVHREGQWSFPTDPEGEDMNSRFGMPYNEDITTLYPKIDSSVTLANQRMDIHFNIENKFDETLFLTNIKLTVDTFFYANAEKVKYNLYKPRGNELIYEIELDAKNMKGFTANKEKIDAHGALFCRLKITGKSELNNTIRRFFITATLTDVGGHVYSTVSDKKYYIAFIEKK